MKTELRILREDFLMDHVKRQEDCRERIFSKIPTFVIFSEKKDDIIEITNNRENDCLSLLQNGLRWPY